MLKYDDWQKVRDWKKIIEDLNSCDEVEGQVSGFIDAMRTAGASDTELYDAIGILDKLLLIRLTTDTQVVIEGQSHEKTNDIVRRAREILKRRLEQLKSEKK